MPVSKLDRLSDKRYVSVVLRVTLAPQPHVLRGELVDVQGNVISRFEGWRGLTRALHTWLAAARQANALNSHHLE